MNYYDKECEAIKAVAAALEPLKKSAQKRIIDWATSRYLLPEPVEEQGYAIPGKDTFTKDD